MCCQILKFERGGGGSKENFNLCCNFIPTQIESFKSEGNITSIFKKKMCILFGKTTPFEQHFPLDIPLTKFC